MLNAVALNEEQAYRYRDVLSHIEDPDSYQYSYTSYYSACQERAEKTVENLVRTQNGITAESHFEKDEFIFFSIPYEEGWSAYIDGKPVQLEKVNVGFMGLVVPAGDHEIEFKYTTPGLKAGIMFTFGGAAALAGYWLLARKYDKNKESQNVAEKEGNEDGEN